MLRMESSCECFVELVTQGKARGWVIDKENGGNAYLNWRYLLDVGCSTFSASIAKRGSMIPIYVSDATSHIDKQVGNSACWGERGRGGQAMGLSDGMYG